MLERGAQRQRVWSDASLRRSRRRRLVQPRADARWRAVAVAVVRWSSASSSRLRRAALPRRRRCASQRCPSRSSSSATSRPAASGKTPLVLALAQALRERGCHPGIVSRGYGGSPARARAVRAGDDPARRRRRAAAHRRGGRLSDVDRRASARRPARALLAAHPACDVVVCDDGLQHYALARDVEIAVVDAARGFGNGLLLPAGPLREPVARLDGVDAVVRLVRARSQHAPAGSDGRATSMTHEPLPWRNVRDAGGKSPIARDWRGDACMRSPASAIRSASSRWCARWASTRSSMRFPTIIAFTAADLAFPGAAAILMTAEGRGKMRGVRRRALLVPAAARAASIRRSSHSWSTRSVDPKLLEMLVCPVTKGPLVYDREQAGARVEVGAARVSDTRRHSGDARGRGAASCAGRVRRASVAPSIARCSPCSSRRATRRRGCRASRSPTSRASRWSCGSRSARKRAARRASSWRPTTRGCATPCARARHRRVCMTRADHPTGTDRLAEAAARSALADDEIVVNVQGDEPLLDPALMRRAWRQLLDGRAATRRSPPRAIRSPMPPRRSIRTWSRSCSTRAATRCTSAARRFRGRATRSRRRATALPAGMPLYRHYGLYAYRVVVPARVIRARAGADRALRGARAAARAVARLPHRRRDHAAARPRRASTRRRILSACGRCMRPR